MHAQKVWLCVGTTIQSKISDRPRPHEHPAAMAKDSSLQIFDPRKYLNTFYSYLNKKPGEEPEVLEFILTKLHEYMKEG